MDKKANRLRRATRARAKMADLRVDRLVVHRTSTHIYAQVIAAGTAQVLASASTVEKTIRSELKSTGNVEAAILVGKLVAERATEKGVTSVAFDRSGFKYHGRVEALANAAREAGLKF